MPRWLLLSLGWIMVVVGIIGVFLPLLPTTPFLLVAVYCFSRSSPRFYSWLINHPRLGPPITAWQKHGVIRGPQKVVATIAIAITAGLSAYVVHEKSMALIGMSLTLVLVLAFIWTRPSQPK